ncbi:hypothetical protein O7631_29555 [Micromonospora sp. WMMD967]|uniref:hypothetical protein n=1 Tax=Micromonospora sp. WMMD967 TaxID=3016101 RepID=UPI002417B20A|nr:hypothetical protein [Micromonospora sp. WMMD967]MDG4840692.1 hypothetical protein [Micromonospora sp. WMMD967]
MDLALGITRWMAGPVAKFVDADGETAAERRAEVIEYAGLPGDDLDDLGLRHITRGVAWFILFGVTFAVGTLILVPVSVFAGEPSKDLVFGIADWVVFFPFFVAGVHLVKVVVIWYLPERRWNPQSRRWRAAMVAQPPEYLLAVLATAANAVR